jgi:UDP-N-acetyl-D-mannosaminuronic acid dehydrogenase
MKVAVVGTGRVGLPLALAFSEAGADVVGYDLNESLRRSVNDERVMPFLEPGFEQVLKSGRFRIHASIEDVADVDYFIITVGTPLLHHIETDLSAVTRVILELAKKIRPGQTVIMRSTTAPHTTRYVRQLLERESGYRVGSDVFLACCPERILEGRARQELTVLPQIVGAEDEASARAAEALFDTLGVEVLHCDFITAELVKLFNNVSRYSYFAIANVLSMIAIDYGAEPYEILQLASHEYPRPISAKPGFTAGTCLRKDFGMLSEAYWSADILVSSWRINESMPRFLVEAAKKRWGSITGSRVAVLGYAFKRDADDVRDTLSDKLLRYLHRECPDTLKLHDHLIPPGSAVKLNGLEHTTDLGQAIRDTDLIFIATNHSLYSERADEILEPVTAGTARAVDIWNALGTNQVMIG